MFRGMVAAVSTGMMRLLPFLDLRELDRASVRRELLPAIATMVMSVPQGIAYALIAGLPPAMGLYAGAVPAIVGSLLRSSRAVIVGPTNAISLIIATSAVAQMEDPITAAATLALLVGVLQIGAGLLRLDGLVDYISTSVVAGYITGAASLILVGQLPNLTGTEGVGGDIVSRLAHWLATLPDANPIALAIGLGSVVGIVVLRKLLPRGVPALAIMGGSIALTAGMGLDASIETVADISPVPAGLPPLTLPSLQGLATLAPVALATMVLSLVESSAVSRTLASRSGQRIDVGTDFVGLGAANVAAALFGGYPVSGSLSRSGLNFSLGARTRLAGILTGLMVLLVPLSIGPLIDYTPIAALAGTIVIVAVDLIDRETIQSLLRAGPGDRLAFLGTVGGTWFLPLDQAIYVGVGISIVLFLRRVRLLVIRELWVDRDLRLQEVSDGHPPAGAQRCRAIRVLHVEGPLFFGAASELESAISEVRADPDVQVIVIRLKRAQGVDFTTGAVLSRARLAMEESGRHLMLVGMRAEMMQRLEEIGVADSFSDETLFPTEPGWFVAMNQALAHAMQLVREEDCPEHPCEGCPLARYLDHHARVPRIDR